MKPDRLWIGVGLVLILALYSYPFLTTVSELGCLLPPAFAADQYLYLNLSSLHAIGDRVVNPWYGLPEPAAALAHQRFGLAFLMFRGLKWALGGQLCLSVFTWNALWIIVTYLSAIWFLRKVLSRRPWVLVLVGVLFLLIVEVRTLPAVVAAWFYLPTLDRFQGVQLPFIRMFFPQVATPMLFAYLGLLATALNKSGVAVWAGMAVIQLLAFASFPYATLLMACTTLAALLAGLIVRFKLPYFHWSLFGLACGFLDLSFLLLGRPPEGGLGGIDLNGAMLPHLMGKTVLAMLLLSLIVLLVRDAEQPEIWCVLVGLGFSNTALLLGDAAFSSQLQISNHALYFTQATLVLLLVYLAGAACRRLSDKLAMLIPRLATAGILLATLHGALVARATYERGFAYNAALAETAELVRSSNLNPRDLIIGKATFVDDATSIVPLVSPARVLFSRNAEFVLTAEDKRLVQRYRQALYLYFSGRDAAWVEHALSRDETTFEQNFLSHTSERLALEGPDREAALAHVKAEILPPLSRIESGDTATLQFFRQYNRIVIIDSVKEPQFVRERLLRYLRLEEERRVGPNVVLWCRPL